MGDVIKIGEKTCRNCAHSHREAGTMMCRREPPKAFLVPNGVGQMMTVSAWPPILDTQFCGEHRQLLTAANVV